MPVLVTSNFDDDSIKNERASTETHFSYYKFMGNFLDAQGQLTWLSVVRSAEIRTRPRFYACQRYLQPTTTDCGIFCSPISYVLFV